MPALENQQQEAFAQARFAGKTLAEAHYAAGYAGDKASASRLNQLHEVKERIAELYRERSAATAYEKRDAVRDLLSIIHTAPSDAHEDHALCEVRMGKDGPYHRLPPKLQAMARLIKLMGWNEPVEIELQDNFRDLLARIRKGGLPNAARHSDVESPDSDCPPEPLSTTGSQPFSPPSSSSPSETSSIDPSDSPNIEPAIPSSAPSPLPPALDSTANNRKPSPTTANSPLAPRHEQFALARVRGLGVMAAYQAAGYTGDTPNLAWRLNAMPEVKARIAELNGGVADALGYHKDDAVRDLILILRATPGEVGPDHPFCEMRMTSWGPHHRFPSKLGALTLLARMLGWNGPTKLDVQHDPDAGFKKLRECISRRS